MSFQGAAKLCGECRDAIKWVCVFTLLNSRCKVKAQGTMFRLVMSTPCSAVTLLSWWLQAAEVSLQGCVGVFA